MGISFKDGAPISSPIVASEIYHDSYKKSIPFQLINLRNSEIPINCTKKMSNIYLFKVFLNRIRAVITFVC
jgi:hypothetical protein